MLRRLEARAPLRKRFSERRWRHTLSVAQTAERLAAAFGLSARDRERAITAALLHDVAKEMSRGQQRRAARPAEPEDGRFPALLHARAGARLAREVFGIKDAAVLRAIAVHPTGSADGSAVGRVLFVADFLEPGREQLDDEERRLLERALAGRVELGELFADVLARKLSWMLVRGRPLHPRSIEAWNAVCAEEA